MGWPQDSLNTPLYFLREITARETPAVQLYCLKPNKTRAVQSPKRRAKTTTREKAILQKGVQPALEAKVTIPTEPIHLTFCTENEIVLP
jgi:hypothetical protein